MRTRADCLASADVADVGERASVQWMAPGGTSPKGSQGRRLAAVPLHSQAALRGHGALPLKLHLKLKCASHCFAGCLPVFSKAKWNVVIGKV